MGARAMGSRGGFGGVRSQYKILREPFPHRLTLETCGVCPFLALIVVVDDDMGRKAMFDI